MKFLCVECDEAMRLEGTQGPDRGSMAVTFACPTCGRKTAMLTNAMETQVVRSLGVKIGGRTVPSEPMETVRGSLVHGRGNDDTHAAAGGRAEHADAGDGAAPTEPGAAHADASGGAANPDTGDGAANPDTGDGAANPDTGDGAAHPDTGDGAAHPAIGDGFAQSPAGPEDSSKCPFTGMVNEAFRQQEGIRWTDGARRRIERIPEYARRMVMKGIEDAARAQGLDEVTESVLEDVRGRYGM